jgi:hypothetical protein
VGVDLRAPQARVSEDGLDVTEVCLVSQHMGRHYSASRTIAE